MKLISRPLTVAALSWCLAVAVAPASSYADDSLDGSSGTSPVAPAPGTPQPEVDDRAPVDPAEDQTPAPPSDPGRGDGDAMQPAAAYATSFLYPGDGASVPDAGAAYYVVELATAGQYWVSLYCNDYFVDSESVWADSPGQQVTESLGPIAAGDSCFLEVYASGYGASGYDSVYFTVARPSVTPEVRRPSASPATFYPRVRDRYRDRTYVGFTSRLDSDVSVAIVSRTTGRTVRTVHLPGRTWGDYYSRRRVAWNGTNSHGDLVPTGGYVAVITSSLGGKSRSARVSMRVAAGFRTVRETKIADGWSDSQDEVKGNCFASEAYPSGNDLDCWGGSYAQATYRFRLPANAYDVNWGVRGVVECCDSGRITKTGERTSPTSFRVRVRVTDWRSFVVRSVSLTYSYRAAI